MLKILVLEKKRTKKQADLKVLRAKREQLRADEAELEAQIEAADDVDQELQEQIDALDAAQTETDDAIAAILTEIDELTEQIEALEDGQPEPEPEPDPEPEAAARGRAPGQKKNARKETRTMPTAYTCRSRCFTSRDQRDAFYSSPASKAFLDGIRSLAGSGKRSVTGAELTIPEEWLDVMRDNLPLTSKLITRVRLRPVKGNARQNIVGKCPDGVWTEAVADLNELSFVFNQAEVDGYKVGGYIPVPNSYLKDSDIDLGEEVMTVLLKAIGQAVDKAIVYGTGTKMPVGIVTRLAQTSSPAYWGSNQGTWTDLHSSHVLKLNIGSDVGAAFFKPLLAALAKASPDYSDGKSTWIMNRATHLDIMARALNFNAAGALVAGLEGSMPMEMGEIVELEFMPDNEIVGGFLDNFVLAEREGAELAQSEHVFFLKDQTVFKGTARYDGQPVVGEAFVAVNYNNVNVTTSKSFAPDYANTAMNVLICTAAAHGSTSGKTVVTVSGAIADSPTLKYAVLFGGSIAKGDACPSGFAALTSGSTAITAAAGAPITVVELDSDGNVVSLGSVLSVPKA